MRIFDNLAKSESFGYLNDIKENYKIVNQVVVLVAKGTLWVRTRRICNDANYAKEQL